MAENNFNVQTHTAMYSKMILVVIYSLQLACARLYTVILFQQFTHEL